MNEHANTIKEITNTGTEVLIVELDGLEYRVEPSATIILRGNKVTAKSEKGTTIASVFEYI